MSEAVFRVGNGAGFSGDRVDAQGPVVDTLVARGGPAALFFEVPGERTVVLAVRVGIPDLCTATVEGDDIRGRIDLGGHEVYETDASLDSQGGARLGELVSANAYLAAHLLECGAQVTGGYYYDPGYEDVPDPANYITPDVALDLTGVTVHERGKDRVVIAGVRAKPAPERLKVTACFEGGGLGEGEVSVAAPNCLARVRMAAEVLQERLQVRWLDVRARVDLIGVASVHHSDGGARWRTTQRIRIQSYLVPRGAVEHRVSVGSAKELA